MANASKGAAILDAKKVVPIGHVDGAELLNKVEGFASRFISYPSESCRVAHVLWIAHTHLMDLWINSPRIAFLSPEPGSGKTRALEVTESLVPRPIAQVGCSVAYLFHKVSDTDVLPTILFDEIDTVFGHKVKDVHEDVRGLLNAGHRRGATYGRCVVRGRDVETIEYNCFCAVAMGGLGDLPDSILSRSVIIRMKKRAPTERIEPYRNRINGPAGHALRGQLEAWAAQCRALPNFNFPEMPGVIEDRDADCWEDLIAVADFAGGDWPTRARKAAVEFVIAAKEGSPSLGVRLLSDLRNYVFKDADELATSEILQRLQDVEEAPWGTLYRGEPIDPRGLANLLKQYGVTSQRIRPDGVKQQRGYTKVSLADPWARYLPLSQPPNSVTAVTAVPTGGGNGSSVTLVTREGDGEPPIHDAHVRAYLAAESERL